MKCQVDKLKNFRHILLYEFNRGAKTAEADRNICAVYRVNIIRESTARKWFSRFKEDRFDISDTPRSRRPSGFNEDSVKTLIHNNARQCTRELANVMNCDHPPSCDICIQWARLKIGCSLRVPHALNQNHKNQRMAICTSLPARHRLAREQHRPFLSCIVTGEEK